MDVAKLQMEVDSRPAKEATEALAGLAKQSELTTTAYGDLHDATARSRDIVQEKLRAQQEATQSTQDLTESQWSLSGAIEQTDEAVHDARLGMEMLRLEYEQGDISQEEYGEGLSMLKDRLQDLDVDTIGSVRTTRMLNKEMAGLGSEVQTTGRMASGSTTALNSMGTIIGALATGSGNLSTRLARVGQSLGIMTQYSGGASAALQSLTGFIMSPAGLIFALGATIPLVVRLTQSLRDKNSELVDTERASRSYTRVLDEVIAKLVEFREAEEGVLDTGALEERLSWSERFSDSLQDRLDALKEERDEIAAAAGGIGLTVEMAERYHTVRQNIAALEGSISSELETQKEIRSDILATELLREGSALDEALQEKGRREAAEWMKEHQEEMVRNQLERREQAEERVTESIRRQAEASREASEAAARRRNEFLRLLESPPEDAGRDDSAEIQRALTRQRLAEDARLAMMEDSVTAEKLLRLEMEREFQQERLELIRQGITDEESLNNLRITQQQRLTKAMKEAQEQIFDPRSIGGLRQEIAHLQQEQERLWDPDQISDYQDRIKRLQDQIKELRGDTEELNSTARDLGMTFESAAENAMVRWEGFGNLLNGIMEDMLRITTRTLITQPLGGALTNALSSINFPTRSVNDALIMKDGQIIEPHADDHILAFKDPAMLRGKSDVNVSVNVVNQSSSQVDVQQRRMPNGDVQIQALVKDTVEGLMNGGKLDRAMSRNFAVTRQGVRRG